MNRIGSAYLSCLGVRLPGELRCLSFWERSGFRLRGPAQVASTDSPMVLKGSPPPVLHLFNKPRNSNQR